MSIIGSGGLGKTSLLAAGAQAAQSEAFWLARARGSELERDLGWGLAVELVEQLLERATPAERSAALAGRAAAAEIVLSGAADRDRASIAPGRDGAITAALTLAVCRLAAQRPLALVVDDAHWADRLSLRWLCHLTTRIEERSILLLVGLRPEEPDAATDLLGRLESAGTALWLEPLSLTATGALVEPDTEATAASQAVHAATGGNPFLIDQLMRHLGGARPSARDVQCARPEPLARIIEARLRGLGEAARSLGQAVAVLDVATSLGRAARVAGIDAAAATVAADRLAAAGVLADRLPLTFRHPLLLGIVRDGIGATRADALRVRAAHVLAEDGADVVHAAVHLLAAEPVGEPWAADLLARAGRRAFHRAAHESAIAFLRRSLAEPMSEAERAAVTLDLGRALLMSGSDDGLGVLREALALMPDVAQRRIVALEAGDAFVAADRLVDGISLYEQVVADTVAGDELRAPALARRALVFLGSRFEPAEVLGAVSEAMHEIDRGPAQEDRAALSLVAILALWTGAPADTCAARLHAALGTRPVGRPSALEWSLDLAWLAAGLAWCDCYEDRDAFLDAMIERARRRGAAMDLALSAAWRSYGRMRQGRIDAAWEDIGLAAAVLDELDDQHHMIVSAFSLDPLVERGQLAEADRLLARVPRPGDDDDVVYFALIDARSRVHIAQRRLQDARGDLELLRDEIANRGFACPGALSWRSQLIEVLHLLGEVQAARALVEEDLDAARRFGAPRPLGQALIAAAGPLGLDAGAVALEEAVAVLDTSSTVLDLARAEVARGSLSRRRGWRIDAQTQLRRGLDLAARCGASALAARATAELHIAGARPRRARLDGPESLTAAERRVAVLAIGGAGNREIAERLVVTRRTVETHLTSVYRKLGIAGREDLADRLPDASPPDAALLG
jgi:DNA-binding CsgD family transcriptional regulator